VSGDVSIAVPGGVGVYLDLSAMTGDVRSDLAPADSDGDAELSLHCRSISGDVHVTHAHVAAGWPGASPSAEILLPRRSRERPEPCIPTC